MKKSTRILSMLLALALVIGILPAVVPTVAEAAIITDIPTQKVIYLSDVDYISSNNNLTNGKYTQTSRDFAWYAGNAAFLLGGVSGDNNIADASAVLYGKGLGMSPMDATADNYSGAAHTLYDISGLDVNMFHAVVGITNKAGQDGSGTGVVFEVYGLGAANSEGVAYTTETALAELKTYWTDGDEKTPLATSGEITKTATHTFDVSVSGLKYLMLVVKCAKTTEGTSDHAYCNSAWADAYVYNTEGEKLPGGYTSVTDGEFTTVENEKITWLSEHGYIGEDTKSDKTDDALKDNNSTLTYRTAANKVYLGGIDASSGGVLVEDGIELGPDAGSSKKGDAYVVYDLTGLNVNTFYSAVGLRNPTAKKSEVSATGQFGGIIFQIYGSDGKDANGNDLTWDKAEYKLLSTSNIVYKTMAGEFDVDVTGIKYLKLYIRLNAYGVNGANTSMDSYFVNACVYYDG